MRIIEQNIIGKQSQDTCEDGLVVTDDFVAVIDGSTSKTSFRLSPDEKNGRYAMTLISEYIQGHLEAESTMEGFCQGVTDYIYKVYEKQGVVDRMRQHIEERLTAVAIVYSRAKEEIWMVGDCQLMVDGKEYDNSKAYEQNIAEKRVALIRQGSTPQQARKAIEPLLVQAMLAGQNQTYAVIDGFPVCLRGVKVISVTGAREVVMASDGYPFLKPTLQESEEALAEQMTKDPQCVDSFVATKGLVDGNKSFDDRTYIRFEL